MLIIKETNIKWMQTIQCFRFNNELLNCFMHLFYNFIKLNNDSEGCVFKSQIGQVDPASVKGGVMLYVLFWLTYV